jgi:hypothetical protein
MTWLIRFFARLLLPYGIRRPLADRAYRLIGWLQYHREAKRGWVFYGVLRVGSAYVWRSISAYRYLLGCNLRDLGLKQKLQRRLLTAFLSFPDRYYRRCYTGF